MLHKLRAHVRNNVVGYIALFFALTGVAYAAVPLKSGDPAGGDLTGTYPDPSIAANAVDSGKVSNDSLTGDDLANGAVGTAEFSRTIPAVRVFQPVQSIPSNTETALTFTGEDYDTAGLHSTTANPSRLTAPVAGIYRVSGNVFWSPNPTGVRWLILGVNGTGGAKAGDASTAANTQQISTEIKLEASDYAELLVLQTTGDDLRVLPNSFTMSWVAPG